MSKLPTGRASSRHSSTAYLTLEERQARYERRVLAWYGRNDLPAMPLPVPPLVIPNLRSHERKQPTCEIWQATRHLLQALNAWQEGFGKRRAEDDADSASALWCQDTAIQSIRVLCIHRVHYLPFDHSRAKPLFSPCSRPRPIGRWRELPTVGTRSSNRLALTNKPVGSKIRNSLAATTAAPTAAVKQRIASAAPPCSSWGCWSVSL